MVWNWKRLVVHIVLKFGNVGLAIGTGIALAGVAIAHGLQKQKERKEVTNG